MGGRVIQTLLQKWGKDSAFGLGHANTHCTAIGPAGHENNTIPLSVKRQRACYKANQERSRYDLFIEHFGTSSEPAKIVARSEPATKAEKNSTAPHRYKMTSSSPHHHILLPTSLRDNQATRGYSTSPMARGALSTWMKAG